MSQPETPLFPWPEEFGRNPGLLRDNLGKDVKLFTPFQLGNLTLKNRIVVSPMCQYSAPDGFFTDWHLVHLGGFAKGGAGLIFTEATAVEPIGRISPYDTGLWSDAHISMLQRIVHFIHAHKAAAGIQLAHAGRKACTDVPWAPGGGSDRGTLDSSDPRFWQPVGPSPVAWDKNHRVPREITVSEIAAITQHFVAAAQRAATAGFDVIEIHGAHGYLISSFLSVTSNQRQDQYGGSLEDRARILLDIVKAVRAGPWPAPRPLFVRISCVEWVDNGWSIEDSVKLAQLLREAGADIIDCSSGGNNSQQKIHVRPGFQVPFAEQIKKEAHMPTMAVGLITEAKQAEAILQEGQADLVCLARELLRDPHWPLHAAHQLGVEVYWPPQYERAKPRL